MNRYFTTDFITTVVVREAEHSTDGNRKSDNDFITTSIYHPGEESLPTSGFENIYHLTLAITAYRMLRHSRYII